MDQSGKKTGKNFDNVLVWKLQIENCAFVLNKFYRLCLSVVIYILLSNLTN